MGDFSTVTARSLRGDLPHHTAAEALATHSTRAGGSVEVAVRTNHYSTMRMASAATVPGEIMQVGIGPTAASVGQLVNHSATLSQ